MGCQIPGINELERISSQAFLEEMDVIMDKAIANNTAIIIDHYGKEVLFIPASLFPSQPHESQEMNL